MQSPPLAAAAGATTAPPTTPRTVVVLGTGGTITGVADDPDDELGYRSAQRSVADLVGGLDHTAAVLETEQIAQVDSKDMGAAIWLSLAARIAHHLTRAEVAGLVVTHGTDTLEETAYFLQRVLAPVRPVVLTGAMRPASLRRADGPGNLRDAIGLALGPAGAGVKVVMNGAVHEGGAVRKAHSRRLDAFTSGRSGPWTRLVGGALVARRAAIPLAPGLGLAALNAYPEAWPWVEIVTACSAPRAAAVQALRNAGVRGLVVATTGNGTLHAALEHALREATRAGVAVLRATRCLEGGIVETAAQAAAGLPSAGALTPVQARIELMLRLMGPAARG